MCACGRVRVCVGGGVRACVRSNLNYKIFYWHHYKTHTQHAEAAPEPWLLHPWLLHDNAFAWVFKQLWSLMASMH